MFPTGRLRNILISPVDRMFLDKPIIRRILLGLMVYILTTVIVSTDLFPDNISLEAGQVSEKDIVAPRSVTYLDKEKTKGLEAEIIKSVANVYDFDHAVSNSTDDEIVSLFKLVGSLQQDASDKNVKIAKIKTIRKDVDPKLASDLLDISASEIKPVEEYTRMVIKKTLQRGVKEEDVDNVRKSLVAEVAGLDLLPPNQDIITRLAQSLLKPNFILNKGETMRRRDMALAGLQPVYVTVKKNQIIVRSNEVVTEEHIRTLAELGMHKSSVNVLKATGLALFVLVSLAIIVMYMHKYARRLLQSDTHLLLLSLILIISLLLIKAAHIYYDYLAPVAAGALLVAVLLDSRLGIMIAVILSLFVGILANNDLRPVLAVLGGSISGIYSVSRFTQGHTLPRTGVVIALTNFLFIVTAGLISQTETKVMMTQGLLGVLNGLISAIVTIGLLPFLENLFKITSHIKLMDLAKPNNPLLQRLLMEAPGTYHHSIVVGNLAESAADAVGADPVLARVGSYFHDVGKIKRPFFFIENQNNGENPHERIAPSLSTLIVTSHIRDGIELARENGLPQSIVDIIQQHHGTSLVTYFYRMAAENDHSECIIEQDFRYEGPRPQTKEAAIVMLADAVEAAVRSLSKPTLNRVEGTVRKIIKERLHDGQFDECNLTLKELNIIGDVYIRLLSGVFHNRIEYPENALRDIERKKVRNGCSHKQ